MGRGWFLFHWVCGSGITLRSQSRPSNRPCPVSAHVSCRWVGWSCSSSRCRRSAISREEMTLGRSCLLAKTTIWGFRRQCTHTGLKLRACQIKTSVIGRVHDKDHATRTREGKKKKRGVFLSSRNVKKKKLHVVVRNYVHVQARCGRCLRNLAGHRLVQNHSLACVVVQADHDDLFLSLCCHRSVVFLLE